MKLIKTIMCFLLLACVFSPTISASASTATEITKETIKIEEGYTPGGVYYEVYDEYTYESLNRTLLSKEVSRRVVYYSATIDYPTSISWTETIDGLSYSGTLKYTVMVRNPEKDTTSVWYNGIIYCYISPNA